jgi:hypothetical protein
LFCERGISEILIQKRETKQTWANDWRAVEEEINEEEKTIRRIVN